MWVPLYRGPPYTGTTIYKGIPMQKFTYIRDPLYRSTPIWGIPHTGVPLYRVNPCGGLYVWVPLYNGSLYRDTSV